MQTSRRGFFGLLVGAASLLGFKVKPPVPPLAFHPDAFARAMAPLDAPVGFFATDDDPRVYFFNADGVFAEDRHGRCTKISGPLEKPTTTGTVLYVFDDPVERRIPLI